MLGYQIVRVAEDFTVRGDWFDVPSNRSRPHIRDHRQKFNSKGKIQMIEVTNHPLSDWKRAVLSAEPADFDGPIPPAGFLMRTEELGRKTLTEYYIPFTGVNENAKIIIAGITPGFAQWKNAVAAAQQALRNGLSDEDVLTEAKLTGAFSGPMRTLFVQQLDHVGFHCVMGVKSSAVFFEDAGSVHLTSVFVHPVFVNDKGLNSIVNLDKSALLRESLLNGFAKEAEMLSDSVIFPLGKVATAACEWLVANGKLDGDRVLPGLQHPSPANRVRIAYFCGQKTREEMSGANKPEPIDRDKAALLAAMKRRFG